MYALVNGLSSDRSIDSAWKIYSKRFIFFFFLFFFHHSFLYYFRNRVIIQLPDYDTVFLPIEIITRMCSRIEIKSSFEQFKFINVYNLQLIKLFIQYFHH